MRTNFVPVVRHILGWRRLKQAGDAMECWTAGIDEWDGVYGICFENLDNLPGWVRGRFVLFYFSHPDKALVERCTLQAAASTQEENYMRRVLDFPAFSE